MKIMTKGKKAMMRKTLSLAMLGILLATLLLLASSTSHLIADNTVSDAEKAISDANKNLITAFKAVVEAEKTGADVNLLTINLNSALHFLNESRTYYQTGNYHLAIIHANNSTKLSNSIVSSANELRAITIQETASRQNVTIFSIIVIISILCVLGYYGWKWGAQRSRKKLMKMRVGVVK